MLLGLCIALVFAYIGYKMAEKRDIDKLGGFLAGFLFGFIGLAVIVIYKWYRDSKQVEKVKQD